MDSRIEFEDGGLRAQLRAAQRAVADLTPLMDSIGSQLDGSAKRRIEETNEAPDGTPWPKSFRVIAGQGGKTLLDTTHLRDRITYRPAPGEVEIGTNVPYAATHQYGATIRPVNAKALFFRLADGTAVQAGAVTIPARPFLGVSRADEEIISNDLVPAFWQKVLADV